MKEVSYGSTPLMKDASSLDADTEGWWSSPWLVSTIRQEKAAGFCTLNWAGFTACHRGMTPQASGYGRRDWAGYGPEAIFIPSFTVMIQVRGCSFMAKAQAIGFYSMTTGNSAG